MCRYKQSKCKAFCKSKPNNESERKWTCRCFMCCLLLIRIQMRMKLYGDCDYQMFRTPQCSILWTEIYRKHRWTNIYLCDYWTTSKIQWKCWYGGPEENSTFPQLVTIHRLEYSSVCVLCIVYFIARDPENRPPWKWIHISCICIRFLYLHTYNTTAQCVTLDTLIRTFKEKKRRMRSWECLPAAFDRYAL